MKRDNQDEADGKTIPKHRDFRIAHRRPLPEPAPSNRNCRARATNLSSNARCCAAPQPATSGRSGALHAVQMLLEIITRREVQAAQRNLFDCAKDRPFNTSIAQDPSMFAIAAFLFVLSVGFF